MPPLLCNPLRPWMFPSSRKWLGLRLSSTSTKHHEPLRVLFCGADAFSIYSLRALHKLQQAHPEQIASIDVVCRPDKRVGRGLKKIQEGSYISSSQNLTINNTTNTSPKSSHQTNRNRPVSPTSPNRHVHLLDPTDTLHPKPNRDRLLRPPSPSSHPQIRDIWRSQHPPVPAP
jgi:hypothetical protein